jgi:hypothetical protein
MWFKVDDNFWAHPKTAGLDAEAVALWVRAGCWSAQYLTDGFVPIWAIQMLMHGETVDFPASATPPAKLVEAGLWVEVEAGYLFHDWKDYQPSSDEVRALRAARQEAGRLGGRRSAQARQANGQASASASAQANGQANPKQNASKSQAKSNPVPVPVPELPTTRTLARRAVERVSDFDTFWRIYPRKVGKRKAQTAYTRALCRASEQDILAGLQRLLPSWTDPRFIPHPTTWLDRDGWEDEPQETAATGSLVDLAEQARRVEDGMRFFG